MRDYTTRHRLMAAATVAGLVTAVVLYFQSPAATWTNPTSTKPAHTTTTTKPTTTTAPTTTTTASKPTTTTTTVALLDEPTTTTTTAAAVPAPVPVVANPHFTG